MMEMEPVDLRVVDQRASNVYEAIIIAAKKARNINDENKIEYNALVSTIPTTGPEDDSEDIENPAQLKIALDFEKREKPHIQALHEFLKGEVEFEYKSKKF